jgi:hypothetical protein
MSVIMAALRSVDGAEFRDDAGTVFAFPAVIDEICRMRWEMLNADEVMQVAKAYYYFSIQFRENLEIACRLRPGDSLLQKLTEGECDTDNLSPYPGICRDAEKLNHDEFMRRLLAFQPIECDHALTLMGEAYLAQTRSLENLPRAASIASYEDGGLSRVFGAMLRAPDWHGAGPLAFRFFLEEHIRFDTDDGEGHGALSRHLPVDDAILPLWAAFRDLLLAAAPRLESTTRELMPEAAD